MRTKPLLFAALVASGVAAAEAAPPRIVHAPVPDAIHAPAPRFVHVAAPHHADVPPLRRYHPRHDPYADRSGPSPYRAVIDRNGWFLHWAELNGNPLPTHRRVGPPPAPSPFHRPIVDRNGWFVQWEDMSGDTSTHPMNSAGRSRRYSDRD
jgi:hypothetical protein